MNQPLTEDATHFGGRAWVYCKQHLRPHSTGWCSVGIADKIKLDATTAEDAYAEAQNKGYKIFGAS
jgi:hypothetical protein